NVQKRCLSGVFSGFSGSPSLAALPNDYKTSGDDSPGCDPVRPCHEYVPPWQVILAALSLLGAGILLFEGDGKRDTLFLAFSLTFLAGVMLLVGHEYYCADDYRGPDYPSPKDKQFLHNRENVSQKHLTYTVYL